MFSISLNSKKCVEYRFSGHIVRTTCVSGWVLRRS